MGRTSHRNWSFGYLLFVTAACGAPPVPVEEETAGGTSSDGQQTDKPSSSTTKPSTKPSTPSSSANEPDGTSGGPSSSSEGSTTEPMVVVPDDHVPVIDPDYPGIDIALSGEVAPNGCGDGFDPETASIKLLLNADVPGVRLHVEDGVLLANGVVCQNEDGAPLQVEGLRQIAVKGGTETNLVILDFAIEGFGSTLYEQEGGFHFDGGQGDDALYVRGSAGDDDFYAGAANQRFVAALSSQARVNVFAKSFETLRASFGPGNDGWREIGRLNVGLYDLDSGSALRIEGIDLPQRLWGGDGNDELNGGALDDRIVGGSGDDIVNGMDGNDQFDEESGANGRDLINGGPGLDETSYYLRTADLIVELCESDSAFACEGACTCDAASGEEGEGDTVINVEIFRSGAGNDLISAGPADNYIYAGEGKDRMLGGAGSDVLMGGEGLDEFDGENDEDICDADEEELATSCEI